MNKAICWYLTCDRYWEDASAQRPFPWALGENLSKSSRKALLTKFLQLQFSFSSWFYRSASAYVTTSFGFSSSEFKFHSSFYFAFGV